jgi:hypothetical protein
VLRMVAAAERVADDLIGQHPGMPGLGQPEQPLMPAHGLIHTLHALTMPGRTDSPALLDCTVRPCCQEAAAFTSSATFFSTAAFQPWSAYDTGHRSPSSRLAASWKPRVEYR